MALMIYRGIITVVIFFQLCSFVSAQNIKTKNYSLDISPIQSGYSVETAFELKHNNSNEQNDRQNVKKKFWILNGTILGLTGLYGIRHWWKDSKDISFVDEGWFESSATNGGADKTGHAFSTYTISRILSALYREIGMDAKDAEWKGPLVGWSLMALVEVGDGFSNHGFSTNDVIANSAGALFAFLEERYPVVDGLLDFRIEYIPSKGLLKSGSIGIDTDYSGMKHLLVFKPSGINRIRHHPLSFLEFHVGYFTRGYTGYDEGFFDRRSRHVYTAVSLNFSRLFESAGNKSDKFKKPLHVISTILEYYQPPHLYIDYVN